MVIKISLVYFPLLSGCGILFFVSIADVNFNMVDFADSFFLLIFAA